uniref:Uncharacterized protein n=1 Tax=Oryza meridionalis TaxID=40149 RepID=A0A0E0EWQ2_9ORYZ
MQACSTLATAACVALAAAAACVALAGRALVTLAAAAHASNINHFQVVSSSLSGGGLMEAVAVGEVVGGWGGRDRDSRRRRGGRSVVRAEGEECDMSCHRNNFLGQLHCHRHYVMV